MENAGSLAKRSRIEQTCQLKIIYTILYYFGLRLNEIAILKHEDIIGAMQNGTLTIIHTKTHESKKHIAGASAQKALTLLQSEIDILFNLKGYLYLGGSCHNKTETKDGKRFITFVNADISNTSKVYGLGAFNYSSHSFRVNYITQLMKYDSVQKAAQLIGHKNINSTMAYNRYIINKDEAQDLLNQAFED